MERETVVSVHFFTTPRIYDLDAEVADAKARLHRSIGQRARWARHDFLREIEELREAQRLFYGIKALRAYGERMGFTPLPTQDVVGRNG